MSVAFGAQKTHQKKISTFLSSVSGAALLLGALQGTARAAGTTVTGTQASFSVTTAQSFDFIDIQGTVTGDVTNNGTVGLPTTGVAIFTSGGGNVGGQIINGTQGLVLASQIGVSAIAGNTVPAPVAGGILNQGTMSVQASATAATASIAAGGIRQLYTFGTNVGNFSFSATNNGTLNVGAVVASGITVGIANATGVRQSGRANETSFGNVTLNASNSGSLSVSVIGGGNGNFVIARGFDQRNAFNATAGTAVTEGNVTINATNTGNINVQAKTTNTSANAFATGINQRNMVSGPFGTQGPATLAAANNGSLTVMATGSGASAFAAAKGIDQRNFFATASSTGLVSFSATNSSAATINVSANGVGAGVRLFGDGMQQVNTAHSNSTFGNANFSITNSGSVNVNVAAVGAGASAIADGLDQRNLAFFGTFQGGSDGGNISMTVSNTSNLSLVVNAQATGASALASANGIEQENLVRTSSTMGNLDFTASNSGSVDVGAAVLGANASATAFGIQQRNAVGSALTVPTRTTSTTGTATFTVNNSGTFNVDTQATGANAGASSIGIEQLNMILSASSSGTVNFNANNLASSLFAVQAQASGASASASAVGVSQVNLGQTTATAGDLTFSATNAGTLDVDAIASGANAQAAALGVFQNNTEVSAAVVVTPSPVTVGIINFSVNNSGSVDVDAAVSGDGGNATATGVAQSNNVTSSAVGGNVLYSVNNSGNMNVQAQGNATGTGTVNIAASAAGVRQTIAATSSASAAMSFTNTASGTLSVGANAFASATSTSPRATANAQAAGVQQVNAQAFQPAAAYNYSNSGSVNVAANATATGGTASNTATATATGYAARAGAPDQTLNLNVSNSGVLQVDATANAAAASANAFGLNFTGAVISGTASNAGTINVTASAPGGDADAVGIAVNGDVVNASVTNTGTVNVLAIGSTTATAVRFATSNAQTNVTSIPGVNDEATFTNDGGTLWAGVSDGVTTTRGYAINTLDAPNPVLINLQGSGQQGNIFGNIRLSDDDTVLVSNGRTRFDGMINGTATFDGALSIASGGTLTLAENTATGPGTAYVDTYTQSSNGTLALEISPTSVMTGHINALVANLDGTAQLNLAPGLYGNTTTFEEVVVASTLNGVWANTTTNTNTPLLSVSAQYPGDDTADLILTRNAFNSLPGLSQNQSAVGGGLENAYSTGLTGGFGAMVSDLFTLGTSAYTSALSQLSGAEHAQNLQTLLWAPNMLNYAITDRINIGPYRSRGRTGNIIQRGDTAVWGKVQKNWGEHDGDLEAPGYDQDQFGAFFGADHAFGNNFIAGFAVGYYENELDFVNGNTKDDDGVQFGLYGAWDNQDYYVRGIFGYGTYDAESRRLISIGTSTSGTALGTYDARTISAYGELGKRFAVPNFGNQAFFTPYAGFSFADARQDAFTETGASGANLAFSENSVDAFMIDLGARFSTAFEAGANSLVIPELGFAWQHNFSDEFISLNTSFAGVPNSNFNVISSVTDADSFLVHAGLALVTGNSLEVKFEYGGRFNSQYQDHSAGLRFTFMFGR